jgi:hypothetical protein
MALNNMTMLPMLFLPVTIRAMLLFPGFSVPIVIMLVITIFLDLVDIMITIFAILPVMPIPVFGVGQGRGYHPDYHDAYQYDDCSHFVLLSTA